jgi:hypothetical protein
MLVDDMVVAVRQLADEDNTEDVTNSELLSSLNRAQQQLVRIAIKKYEPMFMREATISTFNGREATIPEQAFAVNVDSVDVVENNSRYYRVYPAPIRHMTELETSGTSSIPRHYSVRGDKLLLYPAPSSGVQIRVRYQIRPPKLVLTQGRITNIDDLSSGILYVNSLGSDLTTSIDSLKAFVNIIDGTTGLVKGTVQISAIDTDEKKITIKTASLDRSTVFGQTVSTSISTDTTLDDYITIADGTCIPTLVKDYSDYLIQFSVVETLNRLGVPSPEATARLRDLTTDVETMWSGRPSMSKVTSKNRHWNIRR